MSIDSLLTLAEESGFRRTGRTDEIACLCNAYARRGMPMLMRQAGVHSSESDGKDAGYIALREVLDVTTDSTC